MVLMYEHHTSVWSKAWLAMWVASCLHHAWNKHSNIAIWHRVMNKYLSILFNLKGSPFKVYIHLIKGMLIGMNELHASCVWKWASCIISSCVWKWALMYPCCMGLTWVNDEACPSYTWLAYPCQLEHCGLCSISCALFICTTHARAMKYPAHVGSMSFLLGLWQSIAFRRLVVGM